MHSLFKGLVLVFGLALAASSPVSQCPTVSPAEAQKAQVALADFAVNLLKNVSAKDEDKNQILSPVSIALGLALLESGADGKTRQDIKQTLLELGASHDDVLSVYHSLEEQMRIDQDKTKLTIANGLFQDKNLKLKDEFMSAIKDCLKGDVQQVDFMNQLEQTRQKVNQFISDKTSKKVPELFKRDVLKSDDKFVMASAIYMKASWKTPFDKASTKQDVFYRNGHDQDKQNVDFMQQSASLRHVSTTDLDALELAYDNQDLAMYVVLPKARDGVRDLEKKLTGAQLRDIISRVTQKQVNVQLPKFAVRSPIDLKTVLSKMGLDSLFSKTADFKRMSDTPMQVDSSAHEAYLTVDENGTEGAAAAGVAGRENAVFQETSFKVDHPFLYAVVHKQTGAVIFMGKVNSIEQQQ